MGKGLCRLHYDQLRRLINPEERKRHCREYRERHPNRKRAQNSAYRARKYGAVGSHTDQDLLDLREKQTCCQSCYKEFSLETVASLDHKIPLIRGGSNDIENLHLLCISCNSSKKDKTWEEFLEWKSYNERV